MLSGTEIVEVSTDSEKMSGLLRISGQRGIRKSRIRRVE
jgi:hypothetical protein